ncbi:RNA-guided endonuclease InsQ/TnpB family protein [Thermoflexus sp.]|uniref:RNA-guided endonuclease InsQ/TnpB family protein n=1 Tax=Thermoflexus sp. TaxID=1969742 RepID=UPI0035E46289
MRVTQAFRLELAPNVAPRIALAQPVGAARFASHGGLARCREALEPGRRLPSARALHKEWNRWKRAHAPWWQEVSQCAPQEAFRDLERAFRNWRARRAGKPRFKRKKALEDPKARLTGAIRVSPRHVPLPRLGRIRTQEWTEKLLSLLQAGKARILSVTIAREADRWFVRLPGEVERPDSVPRAGEPVGIDLGRMFFLVRSDGTRIEASKFLAKALRLLRRRSRQLSRQPKGSRNYAQASLRLPASGPHRAGETPAGAGGGGAERAGDGPGPALPVGRRCEVGDVPSVPGLQSPMGWGDAHRGPAGLPVHPALLAVWGVGPKGPRSVRVFRGGSVGGRSIGISTPP